MPPPSSTFFSFQFLYVFCFLFSFSSWTTSTHEFHKNHGTCFIRITTYLSQSLETKWRRYTYHIIDSQDKREIELFQHGRPQRQRTFAVSQARMHPLEPWQRARPAKSSERREATPPEPQGRACHGRPAWPLFMTPGVHLPQVSLSFICKFMLPSS
jgi:hypothetical protein